MPNGIARLSMLAAFGLACGLVGYAAAGHCADAEPSVAPNASAGPAPSKAPLALRGMVCAATRAPIRRQDENCEGLELRAKWCDGELEEARRQRTSVRQPWPADEQSIESPDRWATAVEESLEQCDLGVELELVECSEYPCAAALRPATDLETDETSEVEMERLMALARGCAPLRQAFGITPEQSEAAIDVYQLDAQCDERREKFFVLSALDPAGPAFDLLLHGDTTEQQRDKARWIYRRADDLSAMWSCDQ